MALFNQLLRVVSLVEDLLVQQILRSPGFHRAVGRIHRRVENYRHGRNPHEPLKPGEATEEQGGQSTTFMKYFTEELRNQFRGTPTNPPPPPKAQQPKR